MNPSKGNQKGHQNLSPNLRTTDPVPALQLTAYSALTSPNLTPNPYDEPWPMRWSTSVGFPLTSFELPRSFPCSANMYTCVFFNGILSSAASYRSNFRVNKLYYHSGQSPMFLYVIAQEPGSLLPMPNCSTYKNEIGLKHS